MQNLYFNQAANVRTKYGNTEYFSVGKGVRQGCVLSPALFNLFAEIMCDAELDSTEEGVKIGGRILNNLKYADDTTILVETEEGHSSLIGKVNDAGKKAGLHLSV